MEYKYENAIDILDFQIDIRKYSIAHVTRISDNKRIYLLSVLIKDPTYRLELQLEYNSLEKAVHKLNLLLN